MDSEQKVVQYQMQIEDFMNSINQRLSEFEGELDEFQQGRQLAYTEVMEMISTRYKMIQDIVND